MQWGKQTVYISNATQTCFASKVLSIHMLRLACLKWQKSHQCGLQVFNSTPYSDSELPTAASP